MKTTTIKAVSHEAWKQSSRIPVTEQKRPMWWGWNVDEQRWFPCLTAEARECVTPDGVIVFGTVDERDERRDVLLLSVTAMLESMRGDAE